MIICPIDTTVQLSLKEKATLIQVQLCLRKGDLISAVIDQELFSRPQHVRHDSQTGPSNNSSNNKYYSYTLPVCLRETVRSIVV